MNKKAYGNGEAGKGQIQNKANQSTEEKQELKSPPPPPQNRHGGGKKKKTQMSKIHCENARYGAATKTDEILGGGGQVRRIRAGRTIRQVGKTEMGSKIKKEREW